MKRLPIQLFLKSVSRSVFKLRVTQHDGQPNGASSEASTLFAAADLGRFPGVRYELRQDFMNHLGFFDSSETHI